MHSRCGILFCFFAAQLLPAQTADSHRKKSTSVSNLQNITALLDGLFQSYDNKLRPNWGGPPLAVEIDFNVRSMGPISELDMSFSIDCYFRQTWVDERLNFSGFYPAMTLGQSTLGRLWTPDTYFLNGKKSHLHTLTSPNRFVRIDKGRVLYSQRLTVKANCPMDLRNFPMDTQRCPLQLGSFGYTTKDVVYLWNSQRQVVIAKDMKMSQFDLVAQPTNNITVYSKTSGEHSVLIVLFYLQRHTGYFLLQVYAPCILLVVLSWVAFWINREATSDRIALGVTTILTMTFLGLDSRNDLPKVSYSTALDLFIVISFSFVMATIVQFAMVHHFTKRGSGEYFHPPTLSEDNQVDSLRTSKNNEIKLLRTCEQFHREPRAEVTCDENEWNSVSKVDSLARVAFPVVFLLVNIGYWHIYLSNANQFLKTTKLQSLN